MALTHHFLTQHFLYCCLTQEQKEKLAEDLDNGRNQTAYLLQRNLIREKEGFRCSICGRFYPMQQIWYQGRINAPKAVARLAAKPAKFKKAAMVFCGDHYYAKNKNTMLRFDIGADKVASITDEIPVMNGVYHATLSMDEKYMATLTFGDTLAIIDLSTRQIIARKRNWHTNEAVAFTQQNQLLCFLKEEIRCWDFIRNKEWVIWQVPAEWKAAPKPVIVVCCNVFYNRSTNTHWFQCIDGKADYAVVIRDLAVDKVVQLPKVPAWHDLVYTPEQDLYTLTTGDCILLLDEDGRIKASYGYPQMSLTSDGGGEFCIVSFPPKGPQRAFLSPDGKWMLLDFFTAVMLMKREDGTIHHCISSSTGRTAPEMGFVDDRHFWYVWGDTTYIQELPETT